MLICGFEETSYFISFSWKKVLSGLIEDFIFRLGDWHTKFPAKYSMYTKKPCPWDRYHYLS